jgi:hypothetical protein
LPAGVWLDASFSAFLTAQAHGTVDAGTCASFQTSQQQTPLHRLEE